MTSTKTWNTSAISLTAALGGLLFGFDTAVISGALPWVKQQFPISVAMEGWLVSSGLLGCIAGVGITGFISDRIGRRKVLLLSGWMFLLSGLGCAFAPSLSLFIFARFIGGVGVGMASVISPMYIAEFAPAEKRGRMIAYYQLAITIGILAAYFSNALLARLSESSFEGSGLQWFFQKEVWRPMFLMMVLPSVVFLFLLTRIPESPRWLLLVNRKSEAAAVLQSIRDPQTAAKELEAMERANAKGTTHLSLKNKALRLPLFIGITLAVFQQFSGINAIIYYGPSIFESAGVNVKDALVFQTIIGVINLLFTFVAIKTADKLGRKFLLVTGLVGMIISLVCCGLLFRAESTQGGLLLLFILLFIAAFAMSVGPITWILINEIFPTEVRVKAVAICTFALWTAVWVVGQFFPWLLQHAGAATTFWIFAFFCLLNLFFSWRIVRETKNKTLEEVEQLFVAPH